MAKTERNPKKKLNYYVKKGARALKIHPAADGDGFSILHVTGSYLMRRIDSAYP